MSTVTKSVYRSCHLRRSRSVSVRTFASSATRGAIPPESPNYVDIPGTYQTDFFPPRRPKGILPVPREIFPGRQPDKPSEQYLSRAIPPRKASTKSPTQMSEQDKYKSRLTDLRRQHLRSGLLELYNRKIAMTQQTADKSTARRKERARLISQPPREDERLTNTSIPSTMTPGPGRSSILTDDPTTRAAMHARKVANVQRKNAQATDSRRDALHTLYMHARTFISTEKQLAAEIDRIFDHPKTEWATPASDGISIWNKQPPTTIATLLQEDTVGNQNQEKGLAAHRGNTQRYRIDQSRMKRLAEVLSGGKM